MKLTEPVSLAWFRRLMHWTLSVTTSSHSRSGHSPLGELDARR